MFDIYDAASTFLHASIMSWRYHFYLFPKKDDVFPSSDDLVDQLCGVAK